VAGWLSFFYLISREKVMSVSPLKVAAVVFPGFELLDVFGPLELLGMLRERVSISMVAEYAEAVASSQGPKTVIDLPMSEVAALDVLLVPGGWGTRREVQNEHFLHLLLRLASQARFVTSVCTGSALLARTGVLDGKKATSNKRAFDWVVSQGPNVIWVREARWTEDGECFTSSGVSAGMDMTLGLIQRIFDRATSLEIARCAEYRWHEDSSIDPFAAPALEKD
jgi:putative intracellular protease/amidase